MTADLQPPSPDHPARSAMGRPFNFNPGPATLPEPVLQQASQELLDWQGSGMSVLEMSHRGPHFMQIHAEALSTFRRLLGLDERFAIAFLQGGASGQNAFIPLNLLRDNPRVDFVDTGHWSQRSIGEARKYGEVQVAGAAVATDTQRANSYIPDPSGWSLRPDAAYLHLCGNETIGGVEYHQWPELAALGAPGVPLVVDMSSHILSRPMDFSPISLAYGGAQKNIGPSGLTFAVVQRELIESRAPVAMDACPSVFDLRKQLAADSMLNTPPTYAIYLAGLVFRWIEQQGGVEAMGQQNAAKAELLYGELDRTGFYSTPVQGTNRSWMNIPFFLPDDRLMAPFLEGAASRGLLGLKGHKAVGGLRASIYNAMPLDGVRALVGWLAEFEKEHA